MLPGNPGLWTRSACAEALTRDDPEPIGMLPYVVFPFLPEGM